MQIIDSDMYASWIASTKRLTDFAIEWANVMEREIQEGKKIINIATRTCQEVARGFNISSSDYYMTMFFLANSWKYGQELVVWSNRYYLQCYDNNPLKEIGL